MPTTQTDRWGGDAPGATTLTDRWGGGAPGGTVSSGRWGSGSPGDTAAVDRRGVDLDVQASEFGCDGNAVVGFAGEGVLAPHFSADGQGALQLAASAIAAASLSSASAGAVNFVGTDNRVQEGAFSASGAGVGTLVGAARASALMSADGAAVPNFATDQELVDAVTFETADRMSRGADFGGADSKTGILSAWVKRADLIETGGGTIIVSVTAVGGNTRRFHAQQDGLTDVYSIVARNAATTIILSLQTVNAYTTDVWHHLLVSWDLATPGASHVYVDDVSDKQVNTFTNDTIDYTYPDWGVGATPLGGFPWEGDLAEVYFAPGQFLDFSVAANRRKFISASGKPADLGSDGSAPTGTPPLVYLHLDDGELAANFAQNRGTGGNFTITGTLATAATSPSG